MAKPELCRKHQNVQQKLQNDRSWVHIGANGGTSTIPARAHNEIAHRAAARIRREFMGKHSTVCLKRRSLQKIGFSAAKKRLKSNAADSRSSLGATIVSLAGSDTARVTARYIREHRITQAIVGRSTLYGIRKYLYFLAIQKFMSEAPSVDLHIVTTGGNQ